MLTTLTNHIAAAMKKRPKRTVRQYLDKHSDAVPLKHLIQCLRYRHVGSVGFNNVLAINTRLARVRILTACCPY